MKVIKFCILLLFFSATAHAQFLIHLGGGLMNYGGDLQQSAFTVTGAKGFVQGGLGWKFNEHLAMYYSIGAGKLAASDAKNNPHHASRNLSFATKLSETSLTFEYSLIDVSGVNNFTPYAFAGVGAFRFKPYTFDTAGNKVYLQPLGTEGQGIERYSSQQPYKLLGFEIPFGIGVKYTITPNFIIAGEFGFRKLFTDYLDDVSSFSFADTAVIAAARGPLAAQLSFPASEIPGSRYPITAQRGNPDVKDTYYSFQIKLIISLDKSLFIY